MLAQLPFSEPPELLLSYTAFVTIAALHLLAPNWIQLVFTLFDVDGKGRVDGGDIRRVVQELGGDCQEDTLQALIEAVDREGGIGPHEFESIYKEGRHR